MFVTVTRMNYLSSVKTILSVRSFASSCVRWNRSLLNDKYNIYLMGSPGCGKTTVGRILGIKLGKTVIDVDDDILEPTWRMPVSQKLFDVGGTRFLEEEGMALCQFYSTGGDIVSLSGSNPLHDQSMAHIKRKGLLVFLDVPQTDILSRLERMKVNRIVGQEMGTSMSEILDYRQLFYERHHDLRVVCHSGESPTDIANHVIQSLDDTWMHNGYVSTRQASTSRSWTFLDTVLQGLAPDGGLFVKSTKLPTVSQTEQKSLINLGYSDRALRLLHKWISPLDIPGGELREFIFKAYNKDTFQKQDVAPVKYLEKNQYLLELFHGPTASFKDFALQLMPQMFSKAVENDDSKTRYLILVATSGDTGGAVLDGFRKYSDANNVGVIVLYPLHGVSEIQRHQMTTMEGSNIIVIGVDSNFDFCQSAVKHMFQDKIFAMDLLNKYNTKLSAANSLNWGRLVPQIAYHASGYLDLVKTGVISLGEEIDMCVPTGNFGNILAAYYVKNMGFPIRRLICASNSNDVLTEFFKTGSYDLRSRRLINTSSPAIDILKSSNLERLLHHISSSDGGLIKEHYHNLETKQQFIISQMHLQHLNSMFKVGSCSETECRSTVIDTLKTTGYLLDPHTAVAKSVADSIGDSDTPVLISGTAHYGKFGDSILPWLGQLCTDRNLSSIELMDRLDSVSNQPTSHTILHKMARKPVLHTETCSADYQTIMMYVKKFAYNIYK